MNLLRLFTDKSPNKVFLSMLLGAIAGIGFTVSIFIAGLAFTGPRADAAILGILIASLLAGLLGATTLAFTGHAPTPSPQASDAVASD
jgi:NhaA family Na+:H+ antiporter